MVFEQLVQDSQYHLMRETMPEVKSITSFDTFWDCGYSQVQIIAICSEHHDWDIEKVSQSMKVPKGKAIVNLVGQEDAVYARSVCVSVKDIRGIDAEKSLEGLFEAIREMLLEVSKRLTAENGNENEVKIAQNGIAQACVQIDMICHNLTTRLRDNIYAEQISNLLETGALSSNSGSRDGFPVIRLLVLLSGSAFEYIAQFANAEFYFFKQIRTVLHDECKLIIDLQTENTLVKRENSSLKEENITLKKENTSLQEENSKLRAENKMLREQPGDTDRLGIIHEYSNDQMVSDGDNRNWKTSVYKKRPEQMEKDYFRGDNPELDETGRC